MQGRCIPLAAAALAALLLGGCEQAADEPPQGEGSSNTAVLGGYGSPASAPLIDVDGRSVTAPPAPRDVMPQLAAVGRNSTLALWTEDGRVMVARHHPSRGWDVPRPLEDIAGEASDAQLASNGGNAAMALWRHTVGRIDSLRYSRYDPRTGWSEPDVVPGALPRPRPAGSASTGQDAAPRLRLDANGNARAEWLSGFDRDEVQVSTYVAAEGWARPVDLPVAAAAQAPAAGR